MKVKQALASLALTGTIALAMPAAPVFADGAASTRNLILLGGAATYMIIQHNRKVHEKYAEDARRQAALSQENNDAWAAYRQEQRAYAQEVEVNRELKKEVAYQHNVVEQQRHQLAMLGNGHFVRTVHVAQHRTPSHRSGQQVAMVSYGWGDI
ncbi:MAG TPA: hypothetical protein VFN49_02960 [Candidatus Aquilonibacter sp.]|nr:hypothetical protein [Candidatus Aquilonibacter sp.]